MIKITHDIVNERAKKTFIHNVVQSDGVYHRTIRNVHVTIVDRRDEFARKIAFLRKKGA